MPLLTDHEATVISALIAEKMYGVFTKEEMDILLKLIENSENKQELVQCQCGMCYNHSIDMYCPDCGQEYKKISIGTKVVMPLPKESEGWKAGEICQVTGFETIEYELFAIVIGKDGRSWCVYAMDLEVEE